MKRIILIIIMIKEIFIFNIIKNNIYLKLTYLIYFNIKNLKLPKYKFLKNFFIFKNWKLIK